MEKPAPEQIAQLLQSHNPDTRAFGNLILARNLYFDGKFNEAKTQFTKCIEENNNNIWVQEEACDYLKQILIAQEKAAKRIALDTNPVIAFQSGKMFLSIGKMDSALAYLQHAALKNNPYIAANARLLMARMYLDGHITTPHAKNLAKHYLEMVSYQTADYDAKFEAENVLAFLKNNSVATNRSLSFIEEANSSHQLPDTKSDKK